MLELEQLEITLYDPVSNDDITYIIDISFNQRDYIGIKTILKIISKDDNGVIFDDEVSIKGFDNIIELIEHITSEHHENALNYLYYNNTTY